MPSVVWFLVAKFVVHEMTRVVWFDMKVFLQPLIQYMVYVFSILYLEINIWQYMCNVVYSIIFIQVFLGKGGVRWFEPTIKVCNHNYTLEVPFENKMAENAHFCILLIVISRIAFIMLLQRLDEKAKSKKKKKLICGL